MHMIQRFVMMMTSLGYNVAMTITLGRGRGIADDHSRSVEDRLKHVVEFIGTSWFFIAFC